MTLTRFTLVRQFEFPDSLLKDSVPAALSALEYRRNQYLIHFEIFQCSDVFHSLLLKNSPQPGVSVTEERFSYRRRQICKTYQMHEETSAFQKM